MKFPARESARNSLCAMASLVAVVLFFLAAITVDPAGAASESAKFPTEVSPAWWSTVQEQIARAEYRVTETEFTPAPSVPLFHAPNRAHGFRTVFEGDGVRIVPRSADDGDWEWRLQFVGVRAGNRLIPAGAAERHAHEGWIEYRRGPIVEWYVNDPNGLEQGFTIERVPDGVGDELRLVLSAAGSLRHSVNARQVLLRDQYRNPILRLSKLVAFDANGADLESKFVSSPGGFDIAVDISDAVFPVVIDPLVTSTVTRIDGPQSKGAFAASLSSAGDVNGDGFDDVIVGSPFYDGGEVDEGTAFVFLGSEAGITTEIHWQGFADQASGGSSGAHPGAHFGRSVAGAGDVNGDGFDDVIVGAPDYPKVGTDFPLGLVSVYLGSSNGLSTTSVLGHNSRRGGDGEVVASAGDVNADGFADILWGTASRIYLSYGSPTGPDFAVTWSMPGLTAATAGDVNGDGFSDIIVGKSDSVDVYLGEAAPFPDTMDGGAPDTPDWTIASPGMQAVTSVAAAGDVNGDGFGDVAIGVPTFADGEVDEGGAFVYLGSATGLELVSAWHVESQQAGALLGTSVSSAGDVNGDGFFDVIVGAPRLTEPVFREGKVSVYLGSQTGLSTTADWQAVGRLLNSEFGGTVASAGDVNGDGFSDVVVGASEYDFDLGAAFVYLGAAQGLSTAAVAGWSPPSGVVASAGDVNGDSFADVLVGAPPSAFVFHGSQTGPSSSAAWQVNGGGDFGSAVAPAGDVNADGYADVIIGGESNNQAFVYLGSPGGLSLDSAWDATAQPGEFGFGISVAGAGDVNGDGFGDIMVGNADFDAESRASIFYGGINGPSTGPDWFVTDNASALGSAVASAGDVNGDGFADVIVGGKRARPTGRLNEGIAKLYFGSRDGPSLTPDWEVFPDNDGASTANSFFGSSVASAGDVNGDGFDDVVVGSPTFSPRFNCVVSLSCGNSLVESGGAAFAYFGSPSGPAPTPSWEIVAMTDQTAGVDQANFNIGASVDSAGDVNSDGYSDVLVGAPGFAAKKALLYFGSPFGPSRSADWEVAGGTSFGDTVAAAGDVNADGFADALVGRATSIYLGNGGGGRALVPRQLRRRVLLVDDEGNTSDTREVYEEALSEIGVEFDVFHTSDNGSLGPSLATLNRYESVVWFSGALVAEAGPSESDESTLTSYLDAGGCLILSSMDYLWARDPAPTDLGDVDLSSFMISHLGVASAIHDVSQPSVTGTGEYGGLGPYNLVYNYTDFSDQLVPDVAANAVFTGSAGTAGISSELKRTTFWGFPFDAIGSADERRDVLEQALERCGPIPIQPFGPAFGNFELTMLGFHPQDRGRIKLEAEICPPGQPFGSHGCRITQSNAWETVTGANSIELSLSLSGQSRANPLPVDETTGEIFLTGGPKRWRVRVLDIVLVGPVPTTPHAGSWFYMDAAPARSALNLLLDEDRDGEFNHFDADDDNDGVDDADDVFRLNPSATVDTDGDGQPDDFLPGSAPEDQLLLVVDLDDDNDGVLDVNEQAEGTNPMNIPPNICDADPDPGCDIGDQTATPGVLFNLPALTADTGVGVNGETEAGQTITFSTNVTLPLWLSLDSATGAMSGIPTGTDFALIENIVISTSDGFESADLPPFSLAVLDTLKPVSFSNISDGSYNAPQAVFLACVDLSPGSGCSQTFYTDDGEDPKTSGTAKTFQSSIIVSQDTTLKYYSTDVANNTGDIATSVFTFDFSPPNISITSPPTGSVQSAPSIAGTATDSGLGVARVEVLIEEVTGTKALIENTQNDLQFVDGEPEALLASVDSGDPTSQTWSFTRTVPWVNDVEYRVTARATDVGGNVVAEQIVFRFFNADPAATTLDLNLSTSSIEFGGEVGATLKLTKFGDTEADLTGSEVTLEFSSPEAEVFELGPFMTTRTGGVTVPGIGAQGNELLGASMDFVLTRKGTWTVVAKFSGTARVEASESQARLLLVGTSAGYAVIVQGKVADEEGLASHSKTATRMYLTLLERGFAEQNIYYFNFYYEGPESELDDDGDGFSNGDANRDGVLDRLQAGVGIDAEPDKASIAALFTDEETGLHVLMNSNPAPLYLLMVDHGGVDAEFFIEEEVIGPADIALWFDSVEARLDAGDALSQPRVLVMGACYSGAFIEGVAGPNRLIITSSAENEQSFKGVEESDGVRVGEYFLEEFFKELGKGTDFKRAFEKITKKTESYTKRRSDASANSISRFRDTAIQHPLLNDDDDNEGSNELGGESTDGRLAALLILGTGPNFDTNSVENPADIVKVSDTVFLGPTPGSPGAEDESEEALLYLEANFPSQVTQAYLEIRDPSEELTIDVSNPTEQQENGFRREVLCFPGDTVCGEGQTGDASMPIPSGYEGRFWALSETLTTPGKYEVFYYVEDVETKSVSPSRRSVVYKDKPVGDNQAPGVFDLVEPGDTSGGLTASTSTLFDWAQSTDINGDIVTYTLRIASTGNTDGSNRLSDVVYVQEEIETSQTIVQSTAGLEDNTQYHWQVEAIDEFGQRTLSTNTYRYTTDNGNNLVGYVTGEVRDSQTGTLLADVTVKYVRGGTEAAVTPTDESGVYTVESTQSSGELRFVCDGSDPFFPCVGYEVETAPVTIHKNATQMVDAALDRVFLDDDGDGVANHLDAFPTDAAASLDTDGDGAPDEYNAGATQAHKDVSPLVVDLDDDNDLVLDVQDKFPRHRVATEDFDDDGKPDEFVAGAAQEEIVSSGLIEDTDDDNDGASDVEEAAAGTDPRDANQSPEVCDGADNDGDGETDEGFVDTDNDGVADCVDGEESEVINLAAGFNLVGFMSVSAGTKSYQDVAEEVATSPGILDALRAQFPGIEEASISMFNVGTGRYETATLDAGGAPVGDVFNIKEGIGYILFVDRAILGFTPP